MRRFVFLIFTMLRYPIEVLLLRLGFGDWFLGGLRRRIAELERGATAPERVFALQLAYENLQRVYEKMGEFSKSEELVAEQAAHPLLKGLSHYAYLAAANRVLETRPELARRYLQRAKDCGAAEILDREALEMIPRFERALAEMERQGGEEETSSGE